MKRLSLHEPKFHGNEVKYLKKCIKSTWVSTSGEYIKNLKKNCFIHEIKICNCL